MIFLKRLGLVVVIVITLTALALIVGVPTFIIDKSIPEENVNRIKEIQKVILFNSDKLHRTSSGNLIDNYRFIYQNSVDNAFDFLMQGEKEKLLNLFQEEEIKGFQISEDCHRFLIKYSTSNVFVSRHENLYLVWDNNCQCNCKDDTQWERVESIEEMGENWYKLVTSSKRYIGG